MAAPQIHLKVGHKNNMTAFLDETTRNGEKFAGMILFLKRSRIARPISTECTPYLSLVNAFWENARIERNDMKVEIYSNVSGVDIMVNQEVVRQICGFEDKASDPVKLNKYKVRGLFRRVGYVGDITKGVLKKGMLSHEYRYLVHVLQHCLSPRKAGFDDMRESIQNAYAALVLNLNFNFSAMVFYHMVENLEIKKEKYLMYARFVQLILDSNIPALVKVDKDIIQLEQMTDATLNHLLRKASGNVNPIKKRLICHIANPAYIAPPEKKWRNDNSDSDREDLQIPERTTSDDEVEEVHQQPTSTTMSETTVGAGSSQPEIQFESSSNQAEGSGSKKKKKRSSQEDMTLGALLNKKTKFKPLLLSQNAPLITSAPIPSHVNPNLQVSQPIFTSSTTVTTTGTSTVSTESAEFQMMKNLFFSMLHRQEEQDKRIKTLEEENQRIVSENKSLKELVDSQVLMLKGVEEKVDNRIEVYDKKFVEMEPSCKLIQEGIKVNKKGFLYLKDVPQEHAALPDAEGDNDEGYMISDASETESDNDQTDIPATTTTGTSQVDITPISFAKSTLTHILDMQGVIQFSVAYDREEGEIIHSLTKEQIAEMLEMNPDDVITNDDLQGTSTTLSSDSESEINEVIFEGDTSSPVYESANHQDSATAEQVFNVDDADLNEKLKAKPTADEAEINKRRTEWLNAFQHCFRPAPQIVHPMYTKFYSLNGTKTEGKIISWAYLKDFNVYAVKRERGIDYFQFAHDLKTLPYYDMLQLARLRLLYSETNDRADWLERTLRREFRSGWKNLRPQFPVITYHRKNRTKSSYGRLKRVTYKPARVMKKIPLRQMKQNFSSSFRWWYYDFRTTEAVILLEKDGSWELIRIFDRCGFEIYPKKT